MLKLFLIIYNLLSVGSSTDSEILQVGDQVSPINKIQSCKTFGQGREFSTCVCCLMTEKKDSSLSEPGVFNKCKDSGQCPTSAIKALKKRYHTGNAKYLLERLGQNYVSGKNIPISPNQLNQNMFTEDGLKDFLTVTAKNNGFKNKDINFSFKDGKCLGVKSLGDGGKQTLQIFLISATPNCSHSFRNMKSFSWILKETKQFVELTNLGLLQASPLAAFDIKKANRNLKFPAIAFPVESFVYRVGKSPHYMLLMDAAPGLPLAKIIQSKNLSALEQASLLTGQKIGALHKEFMHRDANKIIGPTLVHGDLHTNNIFVDSKTGIVTLIDVETFVKSFDRPATIAVDLFMLYGFAMSHLQSSQRVAHELSKSEWHTYFLKPFLQGYISNWPQDQQRQVAKELKDMFNSPFTLRGIFKNRFLAISYPEFLYNVKKYANPIFNELMK